MKSLLIVIIVLCGWRETSAYQDSNGQPCGCSRSYIPVCGYDGVDYPNPDCAGRCGQVSGFRRGTCDQPALCGCPRNIQEVCARRPNGVLDTFDNQCIAECDTGAKVVSQSACDDRLSKRDSPPTIIHCVCTTDYRPVCGLKGGEWKTYGNNCSANCANVESTKAGACGRQRGCPCGFNYDPVCARKTDGTLKSYSNRCEAECEFKEIDYGDATYGKRFTRSLPDAYKAARGDYILVATVQYEGNCAASPDNSLPGRNKAKRDCVCTRELNPVCALKYGKWNTYSNPCMAGCNGAADQIKMGACPPGPAHKPSHLPAYPDSDLRPHQLPVFPDPDLRPQQLPVFPDSDLRPQQLPVFPDSDLRPQQLPVFPDSDLRPQQLPVFPDSDESYDSDEDIVASQLPHFPEFFRKMFQ